MADPMIKKLSVGAIDIVRAFVKHQTYTDTVPGVLAQSEIVWMGIMPGTTNRVRIRTHVEYVFGHSIARGWASVWSPERGWLEMLPLAPVAGETKMYATATITYEHRVEAANDLMLVAAVAFLREDSTAGS